MVVAATVRGVGVLALLVAFGVNCDPVPAEGPTVREPVTPKSIDGPAGNLKPAPQWKPGDPVRVRPDLKTSSPPRVSEPGAPKAKSDSPPPPERK